MEFRHIRYFLAVAEEGNVTRAASSLGIAQPPLSQQIRQLETEVGTLLFRRVPQGVELTPAGEAFLKVAAEMPSLADRAIHAAQMAMRGQIGIIHLGFTASLSFDRRVTTVIRTFRERFPLVQLILEEANSAVLLRHLGEGSIDAAFVRVETAEESGLQTRSFAPDAMCAALPDGHRAAAKPAVSLADLIEDPLLLYSRQMAPELYDIVQRAFRAAGLEPRLGQVAPQFSSVINLVGSGMGVAVVPGATQSLQADGVTFRPLVDPPLAPVAFASRRGERSAAIGNFINILTHILHR